MTCFPQAFPILSCVSQPSYLSFGRACDLHWLGLPYSFTHVSLLHRSGDTRGRGTTPLSPRLVPALSAHLPGASMGLWGQKLLHSPGGTGHRPTPTTLPLLKGLFPPRCPFGLCEGARDRLKGSGLSAFCWGSCGDLLCPAFALASPTSGPVAPGKTEGPPISSPPHLHPSLFPTLGVSPKLVLTLPATLS